MSCLKQVYINSKSCLTDFYEIIVKFIEGLIQRTQEAEQGRK